MNARYSTISGAFFGGLSVLFGAFGAHALKASLDVEHLSWFETGVRYQMYHALALLFTATLVGDSKILRISRVLFVVGILIFSGSLYALALGSPRILGAVAPLGGMSLMIAWALLFARAVCPTSKT